MKLSHTLAALAFAAAVATALSAIAADAPIKSAATAPAGDHPDPSLVEKGKALYATHCIHCHGVNMVTPGTVAFDLRQFPHNDKARFVNSVTHGKNAPMGRCADAAGDRRALGVCPHRREIVMTRGKTILGIAGFAFALALAPPARAADPLTICLDEDIPIYSVHHGQESKGFDVAVAQAVAKRLDRALKIQW